MKGVLIDIGHFEENGQSFVELYVKGEELRVYREAFDPYLYFDGPEPAGEIKKAEKAGKWWKVYAHSPSDVPKLRERLKKDGEVHESDIPYAQRFLIDREIVPLKPYEWFEKEGRIFVEDAGGGLGLSRTSFDIETYNKRGMSDPEQDPIVMISTHNGKEGKVHTWKKIDLPFVKCYESEAEMIRGFVQETGEDIIYTYNGDNFDLPYLKTRMEILGIGESLGAGQVSIRKGMRGSSARIPGRLHIDAYRGMMFLARIGSLKLPRYTLEDVYKEFTGKEKLDIEIRDLWKIWDRGTPEQLREVATYSLQDAEAGYELGEHLLPLYVATTRLVNQMPFDVSRMSSSQVVESLLMKMAFRRGEHFPDRPEEGQFRARANRPVKGAFVQEPYPGLHENIVVLDFKGLYPSIIISHNIDPGTLNCGCCEDAYESPMGQRFCKKERGLIPEMLKKVIDARGEAKAKLKKSEKGGKEWAKFNAEQMSLKIVANSIAGDEPIVVEKDGKINVMPIDEFADKKLDERMDDSTDVGDAPGWNVLCFKDNKTMFKPITKVIRHKAKDLFEIELATGRKVKTSGDHSVFALKENTIKIIKTKELDRGDFLAVPKKAPRLNGKKRINITKELCKAPKKELEDIILLVPCKGKDMKRWETWCKILSQLEIASAYAKEMAGVYGMGENTFGKNLKLLRERGLVEFVRYEAPGFRKIHKLTERGRSYNRFLKLFLRHAHYSGNTRKYLVRFNDIGGGLGELHDEDMEGWLIGTINGFRMPVLLPLNQELGGFLGYYVSEGSCGKFRNKAGGTSYNVVLSNTDDSIKKEMAQLSEGMGLRPVIYNKGVRISQKMAYLLVKYVMGGGVGSRNKRVPSAIFSTNEKTQWAFLEAYFKGDGDYNPKAKRTRFTTNSKALVNDLVLLLSFLGVASIKISMDSGVYRLCVNEDLQFITGKYERGFQKNMIPCSGINKEISALKQSIYYGGKRGRMSLRKLKEFYGEYKGAFGRSEAVESLIHIGDGDLALEQVKSVKKLEAAGYVYDFSVQDTENFVGGHGLLCLHNSTYGYMNYARARWYSHECAEATTAWGRHYIHDLISKLGKTDFNVLYADTDSAFFLQGDKTKGEVMEFLKGYNAALPEEMELELEGFFPRGIFVTKKEGGAAKKRYALIREDGQVEIKGLEFVRRDWSLLAKNTQQKVIQLVLENRVGEAKRIVVETIEKVRNNGLPIEEYVIKTGLKRKIEKYATAGPHVKAAERLQQSGERVGKGAVIEYVVTSGGGNIGSRAWPVKLLGGRKPDPEYYINNQLLPAVMKILAELGITEGELRGEGRQSGLSQWA